MDRFIITIDGPAGSGKSTIAKLLSERDGFVHINSGALYRAIAYVLGVDFSETDLKELKLDIAIGTKDTKIFYKDQCITDKLYNESIGRVASRVAKIDYVRDYVNKKIRKIAKCGKFVIDGRDCGTVIFPDADVKFYLTANLRERAKRRSAETGEDLNMVIKEIRNRDNQDSKRDIAPLIKPKGAYVIDTTYLSVESVYEIVESIIRRVYDNRNS